MATAAQQHAARREWLDRVESFLNSGVAVLLTELGTKVPRGEALGASASLQSLLSKDERFVVAEPGTSEASVRLATAAAAGGGGSGSAGSGGGALVPSAQLPPSNDTDNLVPALLELLHHSGGEETVASLLKRLRQRLLGAYPPRPPPSVPSFTSLLKSKHELFDVFARGTATCVHDVAAFRRPFYRFRVIPGVDEALVRESRAGNVVSLLKWRAGDRPVVRIDEVSGDWLRLAEGAGFDLALSGGKLVSGWLAAVVDNRRILEPSDPPLPGELNGLLAKLPASALAKEELPRPPPPSLAPALAATRGRQQDRAAAGVPASAPPAPSAPAPGSLLARTISPASSSRAAPAMGGRAVTTTGGLSITSIAAAGRGSGGATGANLPATVRPQCVLGTGGAAAMPPPPQQQQQQQQQQQPQPLPQDSAVFDSAFRSASASEERFGVRDTSRAFLGVQLAALRADTARADALTWLPIKGRTAIDGRLRLDEHAASGHESGYEFCRNVKLGPERVGHKVFLGRWSPQPQADGAARPRPRPRLVSESGFVAVKFIEDIEVPDSAGDAGVIAELETHRRLQALAHNSGSRHLVDLIDAFAIRESHGKVTVALVQELCVATLDNRLVSGVPLTEHERFSIAWRVARALDFVHAPSAASSGFVHRDVRASNILIDDAGAVLLADFGEARGARQAVDLPHSPEARGEIRAQARHEVGAVVADMSSVSLRRSRNLTCQPREVYEEAGQQASTATDVWQLGQVLFMLFSRGALRPFATEATQRRGDAERHEDVHEEHKAAVRARSMPFWHFLRADTPQSMVALIAWCLEHEADQRPSMAAVLGHPAFWSLSQNKERTLILRSSVGIGGVGGNALRKLFAFIDTSRADEPVKVIIATTGRVIAAHTLSREAPGSLAPVITAFFPVPLPGGPAEKLMTWTRHVFAHLHDDRVASNAALRISMTRFDPKDVLGAAVAPIVWSEPDEFPLRYPHVAWLMPCLYKLLVANRELFLEGVDAVPRDVLATLLPRALLPAPQMVAGVPESSAAASLEDGAFAHVEASAERAAGAVVAAAGATVAAAGEAAVAAGAPGAAAAEEPDYLSMSIEELINEDPVCLWLQHVGVVDDAGDLRVAATQMPVVARRSEMLAYVKEHRLPAKAVRRLAKLKYIVLDDN